MPLTRLASLGELEIADHALPRGQKSGGQKSGGQKSVGFKSGGAIRSAVKSNRSSRRKSPYNKFGAVAVAAAAESSGLSPTFDGLGIGSITRARAKAAKAAERLANKFPVPVVHGGGGARGPMERQQEKELQWRAKREAERLRHLKEVDPAGSPSPSGRSRLGTGPPPPGCPGGKPVEQWRDEAWAGFDAKRFGAPKPSKSGAASSRRPISLAPLESGVGKNLPPLRGDKEAERKRRLAAAAKEAERREAENARQRRAVFAASGPAVRAVMAANGIVGSQSAR